MQDFLDNQWRTDDLGELTWNVAGMHKKQLERAPWTLRKRIRRTSPVERLVTVQEQVSTREELRPAVALTLEKIWRTERGEDVSSILRELEELKKKEETALMTATKNEEKIASIRIQGQANSSGCG